MGRQGPVLEVKDLSVSYGAIEAVHAASLVVNQGEIVALLGPNGAGKSSLLKGLMGLAPKTGGLVLLEGQDVASRSTEDIVRTGMTLVPEGRHVFPSLTVEENLRIGGVSTKGRSALTSAKNMLTLFPVLEERRRQLAGTLSGGEQQQLAIARALMSDPSLLLLDEPSLGLAPKLVRLIMSLVADLRKRGTTVLLVEQNVEQALRIADRGYLMVKGNIHMSGSAEELLEQADVAQAYLGVRR